MLRGCSNAAPFSLMQVYPTTSHKHVSEIAIWQKQLTVLLIIDHKSPDVYAD
jgi:hypothetical protein